MKHVLIPLAYKLVLKNAIFLSGKAPWRLVPRPLWSERRRRYRLTQVDTILGMAITQPRAARHYRITCIRR